MAMPRELLKRMSDRRRSPGPKLQLYCNTSDGRIFIMEVYVKLDHFSRQLNIGNVFFTIISYV